ncbi:MAG: hypothetical protein HOM25_06935 [Rhodospirillaceae bacterium]|nr:hypothetical protein [Rhodospirillaceae bacterium]MBT5666241.1 hypothetical protein [Rhodospirillaceae bacterium]MBT5810389.1 hypothetical protein [Rhodospirillaceae bacterium]
MTIGNLVSKRRYGVLTARFAVVAALGSLVAACTTVDATKLVACPNVQVLKSLGEFVRFKPGPGQDPTDVATEAWIESVGGECELEDGEFIVDLSLRISTRRGPANRTPSTDLRYFVAVVDSREVILQRQSFQTTAPFGSFKSATFKDAIELRIPPRKGAAGDAYTIFVGFELSRDELRYNRKKFGRGKFGS